MVQFLTDFADQAVVLPLALVTAIVFAASGWWRGLAAWLLAVGGVLGTIMLLKVAFAGCAVLGAHTGVRSPSGHTGSACIVYGGILLLMLRGWLPKPVLLLLPVAVALLFGASRLLLQVHTPGDVVVGGLVGMAGIAALSRLSGPVALRYKSTLVLVLVLLMATLHGRHLGAEAAIRQFDFRTWLPAAWVLPATQACAIA